MGKFAIFTWSSALDMLAGERRAYVRVQWLRVGSANCILVVLNIINNLTWNLSNSITRVWLVGTFNL